MNYNKGKRMDSNAVSAVLMSNALNDLVWNELPNGHVQCVLLHIVADIEIVETESIFETRWVVMLLDKEMEPIPESPTLAKAAGELIAVGTLYSETRRSAETSIPVAKSMTGGLLLGLAHRFCAPTTLVQQTPKETQ